ncbi:MAG: hypothetical protein FWH19_03070 [Treponema sp.]|nr:hypothetical protein [Treponema sp.]
MSSSVDWKDAKYNEVFEEELRGLSRRREFDSGCTVKDLEAVLRNLYIMEGSDINGRGQLQDTIMAARIAAYERFIAEWKQKT